ncbi:MAG: hypothetical protein HC818_00375 [Synechococcaceae cyanobacterium RM1_1_27]|nr:hypothetical protein [Synechococcaceae cyanobacterium SM2_3_2]NJO85352.1 hypothetical protein [Synechococcaceae cyanobacterium RM1_1_27]
MNPSGNRGNQNPEDLQGYMSSSLTSGQHPMSGKFTPGKMVPGQAETEDPEIYEVPSSISEENRRIRVHTVEGTDIRGFIYLEGTNFERRVSTVMNDARVFISLTDAELYSKGRRVSRTDFICVNKSSIAYVMEDGDIPPHYGA